MEKKDISETNYYDIAVIGLGPAGANFCRLISKKYKAIAFDRKSSEDNNFQKPCGGLLAPDAQKSFARFNVSIPNHILATPQIFYVKTIDLDANISKNYQRFYLNLDRHKFDMWLISLIDNPNITIECGAVCTSIKKADDLYELEYSRNNQKHKIAAKYIVGADGANSIVRKTFFKPHKRHYLSIQEWYKDNHAEPFMSCIFDNENSDCYSWTIAKDGHFIFGGAFKKDRAKELFNKQKKKLRQNGFIFGDAIKREACLVFRPRRCRDFKCSRDNVFLLGEAAGFVSASSLEGISYALDSSYYLSCVLNDFNYTNPSKEYAKRCTKIKVKLLSKIAKSNILNNKILRKIIMKSNFQNINVISKYKPKTIEKRQKN